VAVLFSGCVSAQTNQRLDRTYETTSRSFRARTRQPEVETEVGLEAPLHRDALVALAVSRSPALAAVAHRARSMVYAAHAEGSLPASELGFQAWNLPLTRPYAVGEADMYMLELRQRFPAAGSLDARARSTAEDAQAMLAEVATEERLTAQRAADAYADYVHGRQDHALHHQHLALLEQMQHAVQARFTTGGSGLADAARVDLELAKTRRAIARTDGDIARARATINALLRRAADAPLGTPVEIGPETVHLPVDKLLTRAHSGRGTTLAADARVRAAQARSDAARAEAEYPEVTVGLGYWQDPARRPGVGVTAAMSLPWLWGPQRHRLDETKELEASELSSVEAASLELQSEVTTAKAQLAALEQELVVVHCQAVPAARRSIDAVRAAYTTGNASLLEWVDTARSVLDLELEETDLSAELAHAVAALERAVGAQLPRVVVLTEEHP
jgi:outer membrane protein, heavy metal efflux system